MSCSQKLIERRRRAKAKDKALPPVSADGSAVSSTLTSPEPTTSSTSTYTYSTLPPIDVALQQRHVSDQSLRLLDKDRPLPLLPSEREDDDEYIINAKTTVSKDAPRSKPAPVRVDKETKAALSDVTGYETEPALPGSAALPPELESTPSSDVSSESTTPALNSISTFPPNFQTHDPVEKFSNTLTDSTIFDAYDPMTSLETHTTDSINVHATIRPISPDNAGRSSATSQSQPIPPKMTPSTDISSSDSRTVTGHSRRASISSVASTSTLSSLSRSSKGFLSDINVRRPSTRLASKVRRFSRSIIPDSYHSYSNSMSTSSSARSASLPVSPDKLDSASSDATNFSFQSALDTELPAISLTSNRQGMATKSAAVSATNSRSSLVASQNSLILPKSKDSQQDIISGNPTSYGMKELSQTASSSLSNVISHTGNSESNSSNSNNNNNNNNNSKNSGGSGNNGTVTNPHRRSTSVTESIFSKKSITHSHSYSVSQPESFSDLSTSSRFGSSFSSQSGALKQRPPHFFSSGSINRKERRNSFRKSSNAISPKGSKSLTDSKSQEDTDQVSSLTSDPSLPSHSKVRQVSSDSYVADSSFISPLNLPQFQTSEGFSLDEDFASIINSQTQNHGKGQNQAHSESESQSQQVLNTQNSPRSPDRAASARNQLQKILKKSSRTILRSTGHDSQSSLTTHSPARLELKDAKPSTSGSLIADNLSPDIENSALADMILVSSPSLSFEPDDESSRLKYDLARSSKRIIELEAKFSATDSDTKSLDKRIDERRESLSALEAKLAITQRELEVMQLAILREHNAQPEQLLEKFKDEFEKIKESVICEVQSLITQRNELLTENLGLQRLKESLSHETQQMSVKNTQLGEINKELVKQIQDGVKYSRSPALTNSTNSDSKHYKDTFDNLMLPADAKFIVRQQNNASSSAASGSNSEVSNNHSSISSSAEGTYQIIGSATDDTQHNEHDEIARQAYIVQPSLVTTNKASGKKFWRRGGAAVAKGFNRMFTNDGSNKHDMQYLDGSNQEGGLNIVVPKNGMENGRLRGMHLKVSAFHHGDSFDEGISLFGYDLEKRVEIEGREIPLIVSRCVEEVEERGMDYEGIYRKSGVKSQISIIQNLFEHPIAATESEQVSTSSSSNLSESESIMSPERRKWEEKLREAMEGDICGVTSVLKQYLRYLPIPLVTYDAYLPFITVADMDGMDRKLKALTELLHSLPPTHLRCLEYLIRHLSRVEKCSDKNLMTSRNLAVVFAPTLARDYSGSREIMDAQRKNSVVQFLIDNVDHVFINDGNTE
ncbi:hypothetical protein V1511DRAFT_507368 [Dipodascopsis uninucleata]